MKNHKLISIKIFIFGVIALLVSRCIQNDLKTEEVSNLKIYKDSLSLKIIGDLHDPEIIWDNSDIYLKAYERLCEYVYLEDNQLKWKIKKGEEVNISENIFNYVIDAWILQNKLVQTEKYKFIKVDTKYSVTPTSVITKDIARQFILKSGHHDNNMKVLSMIVFDKLYCGYNLGDIIMIESSDFKGNGVGDASIKGEYPGRNGKAYYYCCNACAWNKKNKTTCAENYMHYVDSSEQGDYSYYSMKNSSHLPLITLRNPQYFP